MLFFANIGLQAQGSIPVSGGNASGTAGSISYSVGQIVYTTNSGTNGYVTQGVQQPYEISAVTGFDEIKGITLQCSAYPNPTTDFINLKVDESSTLNSNLMSYQLCDINGKLLETKNITSNETNIFMSNLLPATYFLKVTLGNKEVKSFIIIKK